MGSFSTFSTFSEVGFGNPTFINTKVNTDVGKTWRTPGYMCLYFRSLYLLVRVGTKVFIFDTKDGFKKMCKNVSGFKIKVVLGVYSNI